MGLKNIRLIFDSPQKFYIAGQTVSGQLLVDSDSPKKLRSIIIKFKGEAKVRWTEDDGDDGEDEYEGHEKYFENRIKVFGDTDQSTLPPGKHCFQFSMTLPQNLPSSFEGDYGHIRYTVKATLDRPWKFDHEVKTIFIVISHLDLNSDPKYKKPMKIEDHKHFGCLCCESGPLVLVTNIPVIGYVPGQNIPLTVEVDNASNVLVYEVVCELQKCVTYHATKPCKKKKKKKVNVRRIVLDGSVRANDSRTWAEKFSIPPLPPSIFEECKIIDLEYKLKVKVMPDGMYTGLKISMPITIGTVPLWGIQNNYNVPSASPLVPALPQTMPPVPPVETEPTTSYPEMPPPTYKESVFGTTDIGDTDDNSYVGTKGQTNPCYPTYNLPN